MAVNDVAGSVGSWDISLSPDAPRNLLDLLRPTGHIAIVAGRVDPQQYGDNLLATARYVGVQRGWSVNEGSFSMEGVGMIWHLGDEDGKGAVFETAVAASGSTFANAVRAVLPDSVTEGTLYSVPGTYNYSYQWKNPRQALTDICDVWGTPTFPVEFRVNGDGSLDAGRIEDLYGTTPTCLVIAKETGYDLDLTALPGKFQATRDIEDFSTRVVAMGQGEGETISASGVNLADIGKTNPYLDLFGNPVQLTRIVDASDAENTNLYNLAAQQLGRFASTRDEMTLSADEYDISGDLQAGHFIYAYDPDSGLFDTDVEVYFRGQRINPVALRVLETTWPVVAGMTVAFRTQDGDWLDLTDYVQFESASTTSMKVAGYDRALTSSTTSPPGDRVNGDSSVPGVPVFGTFVGGTYQANGDETKAQIQVVWTEPLNTDGSTIVDGDHYEIRYRPNVTAPYAATWNEASQDTWNELHTWNQPRVAAITSTDWQTSIAPWDTDAFMVQELTPSVVYEFQIRAVDTANPPNRSQWSATTAFEAPRDTQPPSTPAAPLVAGSRIAIQVVHYLGSAAGGSFTLEPDTNHLEVHVSNNSTFLPDDTTIVGRLAAAAALQAGVPVVGTFQVEETDERYVKVVAVDRSGNKSAASDASSATVLLIDDAHISDLTVTKVTAGTITADWLLAAAIKTAASGQRVELNAEGLQAYGEEGDQTINLSSDPTATGNYITFTQGDTSVASISEDGNIAGQDFNVNGDLVVGGTNILDLIATLPKGLLFRGERTDNTDTTSGSTEVAFLELDTTLEDGRMYRLYTSELRVTGTVIGDTVGIRIRDGGSGSPSITSDQLCLGTASIANTGTGGNTVSVAQVISVDDSSAVSLSNYHSGQHNYLLTVARVSGTGTMTLTTNTATVNAMQLCVEDIGPLIDDTGVDQSSGGGGTVPVQTYTKTYTATWSGTYAENNTYTSFYGNDVNQGRYDSTWGNQRGLIGFNAATIQSDLAGATIKSIKVTLNAKHWYYNSGGTALIGAHDYTSRPSTWSDSRVDQSQVTVTGWPKPGKKTVTLPTSIGNQFRDGTTAGISLGPGTNTDLIYYGRFDGVGSSNVPTLTITYTV